MKILKQLTMAIPDTTDIEQSLLTFPHVTHQGEIEKDRQGTTTIIIFMIQMMVVTVICGSTTIMYHTRTVLIGIIVMIGIIAIRIIKIIIIITMYMIVPTLVIIEGIIVKIISHHRGKTDKIELSEINSPDTVMHHTLEGGGHFRILLVVKKKSTFDR